MTTIGEIIAAKNPKLAKKMEVKANNGWSKGPFGSCYKIYFYEESALVVWDDQPQKKRALALRVKKNGEWQTAYRICYSWKTGKLKCFHTSYQDGKRTSFRPVPLSDSAVPRPIELFAQNWTHAAAKATGMKLRGSAAYRATYGWLRGLVVDAIKPHLPKGLDQPQGLLVLDADALECVPLLKDRALKATISDLKLLKSILGEGGRAALEQLTGGSGPGIWKACMAGLEKQPVVITVEQEIYADIPSTPITYTQTYIRLDQIRAAALFDSNDYKQRVLREPLELNFRDPQGPDEAGRPAVGSPRSWKAVKTLMAAYPEATRWKLLQEAERDSYHFTDLVRMWCELIEDDANYPAPVKPGTVVKLHDRIGVDHRALLRRRRAAELQRELPVPEEFEAIDGKQLDHNLTLVLPKIERNLVEWGDELSHCVGSYGSSVIAGRSLILGVLHNGVIKYTLEINPRSWSINQFYGKRNSQPEVDHHLAVNAALYPILTELRGGEAPISGLWYEAEDPYGAYFDDDRVAPVLRARAVPQLPLPQDQLNADARLVFGEVAVPGNFVEDLDAHFRDD